MKTMKIEVEDYSKIKDRALRLLARRDHSKRELKNKLRTRTKLDDATFERLVENLQELGYLVPEAELTQRWVKEWRGQGRGRIWIEGKLRTKGLPSAQLRDDEEEFEAAKYFLEKKIRGKEMSSLSYVEKGKISRSMISRGFSNSVANTLMHEKTKV